MTRPLSLRRAIAGFTLIEIVVVLAVVAVAAALTAPAIRRGTEGLRLRAAAGSVAALLREARVQAVTHRRPTRVSVNGQGHTVELAWDGGAGATALRRVELPDRVRVEPAAGGDALTFSPRGVARDLRWVVEGTGGRRVVVEVHGVTGRVVVTPAAS